MENRNFYSLLDKEIEVLLTKYAEDAFLKSHAKGKNQKKAYAFLIWFMEFYLGVSNYQDYITEGDNDFSCDLLIDYTNRFGEKVFCIVQAKWKEKAKGSKISQNEIFKVLNNFDHLSHSTQRVNDKLEKKLEELHTHQRSNGEVRYLFVSLEENDGAGKENIEAFLKGDSKKKVEIIDIHRLKEDYITRHYKKIKPLSPFENYPDPKNIAVNLRISKPVKENENFIYIDRPYPAYIFLLRPSMIHELFKKYGFFLFHKNVRNPLLQSDFNQVIKSTAENEASYFWYYNNGLTAITYNIPPIGKQAEVITLTGLQIINGAQTVYAVYRAYEEASPPERQIMERDILLTLRLLQSGGQHFDLNVTRYTNSQNPVTDSDFLANDPVQLRLQRESFNTQTWYEIRRGEFRDTPEGVKLLSANREDLVSLLWAYKHESIEKHTYKALITPQKEGGLYERLFNENLVFEDLICTTILIELLRNGMYFPKEHYVTGAGSEEWEKSYFHAISIAPRHCVALFKTMFTKYQEAKQAKLFPENQVSSMVSNLANSGDIFIPFPKKNLGAQKEGLLEKIFNKCFDFLYDYMETVRKEKYQGENNPFLITYLDEKENFMQVFNELKQQSLSVEDF